MKIGNGFTSCVVVINEIIAFKSLITYKYIFNNNIVNVRKYG